MNLKFELLLAVAWFDRNLISSSGNPLFIYYGCEYDKCPENFDCVFDVDYNQLSEIEKEKRRITFLQSLRGVQEITNICLN